MANIIDIDRNIGVASRALGRHRLVHAYGHCSVRVDAERFRVSPARPLGLVTDSDPCVEIRLDAPLPEGVLGEVRAHREIYRLRPDVNAVVRCMPPKIMILGAMRRSPRARHGFGSYFYPSPPLWDDVQLLREDAQAVAMARKLAGHRAMVLRGNGAIIVGASIEEAVVLTWYLEDAARLELECLACGLEESGLLTQAEAIDRATWSGRIVERMWEWLTST